MGRLDELLILDKELAELERRRARDSFAVYAGLHIPAEVENDDLDQLHKLPMPARYLPAAHHQLLCEKLQEVADGTLKRLMVFMPPGSAKSTYVSALFPAYYLGRHPNKCVLQGSYNADLADRFGRRARNAFASPTHQEIFATPLGKGAAGEWETALGGEYFSFGMKTGVTGRRGDLIVIDDAIKGRKEADSKTERDSVWETYKADVRTRMKPGASIVYVATRWHEDDPAGRILPENGNGKSGWVTARDGERWYVLSLVAVVETQEEEDYDPLGRKIGEWLWPEWFPAGFFDQEKITQGSRNWNALYQQKPKADEGAVLKRGWWRLWKDDKPPKCEYIVSVYDTAFEPEEQDDYSARTTWGIFWIERPPPIAPPISVKTNRPIPAVPHGQYCAILLERWKGKVEFPDLRRIAQEHYDKYKPDRVLIEKKSSGHSLIQELRRAGVPVRALAADKSKLARAHAASVVLEQGAVYYMDKNWAQEVINDCAKATFIKGDPGNDIGDTCVYAWLHLRNLFWLQLEDEDDEPEEPRREIRLGYGT
jgi:predicted phage terminase large subunit-like protein